MRWLMLMALGGCGAAEIATADPTRCTIDAVDEEWHPNAWGSEGFPSEEMVDCCAAAAKQDCRAGFLAVEALYGPADSDTTDAFIHFAESCMTDDYSGNDAYCEAYCSVPQCSDYVAVDPQVWAGDEGVAVQGWQDCTCSLYE